jgi:CDP-glycerol glycerophosphotransferase (TagB/SpsB family)
MMKNENYPFWDLVAEEAYNPRSAILRGRTWESFIHNEMNKNVYMFGCNDACRMFIEQFGGSCRIAGVLDNSKLRWGADFAGCKVYNPNEIIPKLKETEDVIVIAMRLNADKVSEQIESLEFHNYYGLGVLVAGMTPYAEYVDHIETLKKECPVEDIIMTESTNDFDGNSGALYEYLKSKGSSHKFVWIVKEEDNKKLLKDPNDVVLCPRKSIDDLKEYIRYRAVSKWQIWDNYPIRKVRDEQINVFLQHFGMGYKQIANIFNSPEYVDYALNTNENVYEYEKHSLLYAPNTRMIFGELPRNDVLFSGEWHELEKITDKKYDKVVMWAPTLRDSKLYNRVDSDLEYPFGISVIYLAEDMERLNDFLQKHNMLLIIKIHPRQKCNYTDGSFSNILYMDAESIKKVHAYKLMTQVDAMISDYSSIVFDYMLLNRPIAWALEDVEHYQIEFLMDNPLDFMPGEKIYSLSDLFTFLENVYNGVDLFKAERNIVSNKYNAPRQGRGCENIVRILGL